MTMMELQRTYHAVNEWQWTYPQFRQHVPRLAGHTERGFPVCLVLLDMPVDAGLWDVRELQLLGTGSQPMNRDEKGESDPFILCSEEMRFLFISDTIRNDMTTRPS